ncbi:MAG: hypothetical protein ACLUJC_12975 [Clostridia bacterium]
MYKNKLYVMDADCLRNGSLFCRFAGKVNIKMNQLQALWQMRDPKRQFKIFGHAFLFQLNKGIG